MKTYVIICTECGAEPGVVWCNKCFGSGKEIIRLDVKSRWPRIFAWTLAIVGTVAFFYGMFR